MEITARNWLWTIFNGNGAEAIKKGSLDDAQSLYLTARTQAIALGTTDERVGRSLTGLGMVQFARGTFAAAEPLFRQSIEILELAKGKKDSALIPPLQHLGKIGVATSRWTMADSFYTRAAGILKKHAKRGNSTYGNLLFELAGVCDTLGNSKRAGKLLKQALKADKKFLGDSHLSVVRDVQAYARNRLAAGKTKDAAKYFAEAAETAARVFGASHPDLIVHLDEHAAVLQDLGKHFEALALRQRAEAIRKEQSTE